MGMTKRISSLVLVSLFLFSSVAYAGWVEKSSDYPVIEVDEVEGVVLKMSHIAFGKFKGYLIFYNEEGEVCAVKPLDNPTLKHHFPGLVGVAFNVVSIEKSESFIGKWLDITPDKFRSLELENGEIVPAYPIESSVKDEEDFYSRYYSGLPWPRLYKLHFMFKWLELKADDFIPWEEDIWPSP